MAVEISTGRSSLASKPNGYPYDDYAVIDLQSPVGKKWGWMIPDNFYNPRSTLMGMDGANTEWITSGFPGGKTPLGLPAGDGGGRYEWYTYSTGSYGIVSDTWLRSIPPLTSNKELYSNLIITHGDSGSPLFVRADTVRDGSDSSRTLVYGIADTENPTVNTFTTIDGQRLNQIMKWMRTDGDEPPLTSLGYPND
jgi:hypothetical protein